MDHGALDDALEARCGLGVLIVAGDQVGEIVVDKIRHGLAQGVEVDVASPHHGGGISVVDQSEQQVLQRRIFMVTLVCVGQGLMQRFFEAG